MAEDQLKNVIFLNRLWNIRLVLMAPDKHLCGRYPRETALLGSRTWRMHRRCEVGQWTTPDPLEGAGQRAGCGAHPADRVLGAHVH